MGKASFLKGGDMTGAFSDGAVLFPLLVALTLQTGMDGAVLMATAGAAYLAAGVFFRVPMPVQPLKSVVVTALAIGATAAEIRWSGLCVGAVCLGLSFIYADKLAGVVPRHLVHGLQMALGIMLMVKGVKWGWVEQPQIVFALGFAAIALFITWYARRAEWPVMGWVATGGMAAAMGIALFSGAPQAAASVAEGAGPVRFDVILALVLPQLALTLTNSVVATCDVAQRYFPERAQRVTASNLLRSIGLGNLFAAAVGGLPHCHGSGGMTAHVKGGAHTWRMNLVIGGVLLGLACVSWLMAQNLIPAYPKPLMAALLFATGWFHIQLAAPSWRVADKRWRLVVMGAVAVVTMNMLWTLLAGVAVECAVYLLRHVTPVHAGGKHHD